MTSSNFDEFRVGDLIDVVDYVANGSFAALKENVTYKDTPDYAVLIRLADHNSNWEQSKLVYVDENSYKFLKKSVVYPGDIIISNVGANAGTVFVAPDLNMPMTLAPNSVLIRPKKEAQSEFFREYLYYFYSSPYGQNILRSIISGSAQPKFNKTDLRNTKIRIPNDRNFRKIVELPERLDNKIANNTAMNQTLEKIAQRIFKSWFIDFDPVKANKEGLPFDGLSPEIQALFPNEFEDSELGMIPKGWSVDQINKLSQVAIGKTPPRKQSQWFEDKNNENNTKWFSIKDMGSNGMYALNSSECLTNEAIDKFNVKLVPENTVILSFKLTLGRLSITTEECATNEAIAHFKLDEKHNKLSSSFIYFYLKNFNFNLLGSTSSIATAINSKMVKEIPVLYSDSAVMSQFSKTLDPLLARMKLNAIQNDKLERIRDRLLPRLISGQISVGEAAQELAEAV